MANKKKSAPAKAIVAPPRSAPPDGRDVQPREPSPGNAPVKSPVAPADARHPEADAFLRRHRYVVASILAVLSFFLFMQGGTNWNGGDSRGLTDLAYWAARTGEFSLANHPAYNDPAIPLGGWAARGDDGRAVSVYPVGTVVFTAVGLRLLEAAGTYPSIAEIGPAIKTAACLIMALAVGALFLVLLEFLSAQMALIGAFLLFGLGSPVHGSLAHSGWTQTGALFSLILSCLFALPLLRSGRLQPTIETTALVLAGFFAVWAFFCRTTFGLWGVLFFAWALYAMRAGVWKPALGGLLAAVAGFALNKAAMGGLLGSYVAKAAGEAGFGGSPVAMAGRGLAMLFSPTRGMFLFMPWTLLFVGGLGWWISGAMRHRPWRDFKTLLLARPSPEHIRTAFLLAHLAFAVGIFLVLCAFRQWHGGWAAGPRLQADFFPSALLASAPVLAWLGRRLWGIALVCVLALPAVLFQGRAATMVYSFPEEYVPAAEIDDFWWDWKHGSLAWYWTGGGPYRSLVGYDGLEPVLTGKTISASEPNAERFLSRGVRAEAAANRFAIFQREAEWVFQPAPSLGLEAEAVLLLKLEMPLDSRVRELSVAINGRRTGHFHVVSTQNERTVALRIPAGAIESGAVNTLTLTQHSPTPAQFGNGLIHVQSLLLSPWKDVNEEKIESALVN
ncbi:MAG: hypothetical protein RLY93_07690 [Sumerlaeia bacterium]